MRKLLFGVMMLAMMSTTANARSYYDEKDDWVIFGENTVKNEGYSLACAMMSQRPTDSKFLYMLVTEPQSVEWRILISSKLASGITSKLVPGPIDAVIESGSSELMKLKGVVSKDAITFKLKGDTRSNQTQRMKKAILEESKLKITLNRQGTPPDTITVSLDGASDALVSMSKCVGRLLHLDD